MEKQEVITIETTIKIDGKDVKIWTIPVKDDYCNDTIHDANTMGVIGSLEHRYLKRAIKGEIELITTNSYPYLSVKW